jgi:protein TonB
MGYQALLFCPDEKLARVVSQVFGELEFAVDPVNEPFAAVKKLMAQRYDAVVVDSTDEQNTSLLFKSARNSSCNQSSLAIAVVEGQAGVAKAYRIGANLVLTKPINVEQAKGTLRVARGLLRKNADAATAASHNAPAAAAMSAHTPAASPIQPASRIAEPAGPPQWHGEVPKFETPLPAMAASAKVEDKPATAPAPAARTSTPGPTAQTDTPLAAKALPETALLAAEQVRSGAPKVEAPKPVAAPAPGLNAASISQNSAAAAAPAKEVVAPAAKESRKQNEEIKQTSEKLADISHIASSVADFTTVARYQTEGPSFAALGEEDSAGSGGSKKFVIAAVVVLALGATAYFGWTKLGQSHHNATPQPVASAPEAKTAPVPAPAPELAPTPASPSRLAAITNPASAKVPAVAAKASAVQSDQPSAATSPVTRITLNPEAEITKPVSAPIQVKPAARGARNQAQTGESAVQLPSPLDVSSSSGTDLGGVLASSSSLSTPVLARVKISQGVSQGLLIKRVQPKYPAGALATHAHGVVQIEATIDRQGNVVNPKVLSGDPMLAAAALAAVRQWRYKPYYLDGAPVEIQTQITINFRAD